MILTYDITERSSFNALGKWLSDIKDNVIEGTFIILCGNKIDLNNKRVIPKEEGEKFAKENNISFAETSATTGQGIEILFNTILGNFCEVPCQNKENKYDDLDIKSGDRIIIDKFPKENEKDEKQKKKKNCCYGGGKNNKKGNKKK